MTGIFKFPVYEQHPTAAKLMPGGMDDAEFRALKEDIDAHGVLMPVTLYEGKVLDGWHRYRAAKESGCSFKEIEYKGSNPAGYITSVNVLRRKLSSLQRTLVGARLHLEHKVTQRDVCGKLGISNETLSYVLMAINSGNNKLMKRLEDDEFTKGLLREELYDLGLLDANGAAAKKVEAKRAPPNSIFQAGTQALSAAGAAAGIEHLLAGKDDTEGSEDTDPNPVDTKGNTGLKAGKSADKKPKASAAQALSEGFKSLMLDEQVTFVQMNWKAIKAIASELRLLGEGAPAKPTKSAEVTPISALTAKVSKDQKVAAKKLNGVPA